MPDENSGPSFTVNDPQVRNLIQGQQFDLHMGQAASVPVRVHSFEEGPLLIGRIPALAAARQERLVVRALNGDIVCQVVCGMADKTQQAPNGDIACHVLSGMAGVGKTQIAAIYARQLWNAGELDLLVWVNATTRDDIVIAFAEAGVAICGAAPSDGDRAAATFLSWLDRPAGPKWLVVLDGLTNPAHLADLWPPETMHGRTMITTRTRNAALEGAHRRLVDIGPFTPKEARGYMERRLGRQTRRVEGAAELAEDLGFLPLALAQAAAFILERPGTTCDGYRRLLAELTPMFAELSPRALPDGYPVSMAAALNSSIELADRHRPRGLASAILTFASFLDPAGIPIDVFTAKPALKAMALVMSASGEAAQEARSLTAFSVKEALGSLHQLHLLDFDGDVIRVHVLIQRVVRERLEIVGLHKCARSAADALQEIWPSPENDPTVSTMLRANIDHLNRVSWPLLFNPDAHPALYDVGQSLGNHGLLSEATEYYRVLAARCDEFLGPDHLDTLEARQGFAYWLGISGDVAEAFQEMKLVVADYLRVFGPAHPRAEVSRRRLARFERELRGTE